MKSVLEQADPKPDGIRIAVKGMGCAGFGYDMKFVEDTTANTFDKIFVFDSVKVFIDQASILYLSECEVDYLETLESSGFKFNNSISKTTCGCGHSFSV